MPPPATPTPVSIIVPTLPLPTPVVPRSRPPAETENLWLAFRAWLEKNLEMPKVFALTPAPDEEQIARRCAAQPREGQNGVDVSTILAWTAQWLSPVGTVVNVRDFGAKGDGVSDDAYAIQQALDALPSEGGTVWFPPGTYRLARDNPIIIPRDNIRILGEGYSSRLHLAFNNIGMLTTFGHSDIVISGLRFTSEPDLVHSAANGAIFVGEGRSQRIVVANNIFEGIPLSGIVLAGSANEGIADVAIVGNTIIGNMGEGIYLSATNPSVPIEDVVVVCNIIRENGQGSTMTHINAIDLFNARRIIISNNLVIRPRDNAITILGESSAVLIDSNVVLEGQNGVNVAEYATGRFRLSNNTFLDQTGLATMLLAASERVLILGNYIRAKRQGILVLPKTTNYFMAYNRVEASTPPFSTSAMEVNGSRHTIVGNTLTRNGPGPLPVGITLTSQSTRVRAEWNNISARVPYSVDGTEHCIKDIRLMVIQWC